MFQPERALQYRPTRGYRSLLLLSYRMHRKNMSAFITDSRTLVVSVYRCSNEAYQAVEERLQPQPIDHGFAE